MQSKCVPVWPCLAGSQQVSAPTATATVLVIRVALAPPRSTTDAVCANPCACARPAVPPL